MDFSADIMDVDEMDIDLGTDANIEALEAEAMHTEVAGAQNGRHPADNQIIGGLEAQQEKVYIRGLDHFATEDVKRFSSEHFPAEVTRIEWIDDTSANIHFASAEFARDALAAFLDPSTLHHNASDPFALRRAKQLSTHPHVELYVRTALATDVKRPRAHEASRYYLLNPEQDPRERRQGGDRRGRGGYRDRKPAKRELDDEKDTPFDVNLYDDDPDSLAARIQPAGNDTSRPRSRRRSTSPRPDTSRRRRRSGSQDELFSKGKGKNGDGRLRDRSASPTMGGDGTLGFEENENSRMRRARRRSFTPPSVRLDRSTNAGRELLIGARSNAGRDLVDRTSSNNGRELINRATNSKSGVLQQSDTVRNGNRELFPTQSTIPLNGNSTELFPTKAPTNHRRKAAFDAADGTGDLFSSRMSTPLRISSQGAQTKAHSLADRISGGASQDLFSRTLTPILSTGQTGLMIRGSAVQETNPGFSIRGAAGLNNPRVKELFPDKGASNEGKELFGRVSGKGRPRKTAEDMFT